MSATARIIGYTLLNLRFASLLIPFGIVAYMMGLPAWMTWVAFGMLVFAMAGELFTSVVQGIATHESQAEVQQVIDTMTANVEAWANGEEWLDGSEEGEAGGEGEAPVPGR